MSSIWSKHFGKSGFDGLDYWEYFGVRLVENAKITPGNIVLDLGCGKGSSLFPAAENTGETGYISGIDICQG